MPRGWFAYDGFGDTSATGNYTYVDHVWECIGTGAICVVYAYYTPTTPVLGVTRPAAFTPGLQSYINISAAATQPLPINAGAKKYAYVREG